MMRFKPALVVLLLLPLVTAPDRASAAPLPAPRELRLVPAGVSKPVLAHPLLPDVTELEAGDAAQLYLTACLLSAQARAKSAADAAANRPPSSPSQPAASGQGATGADADPDGASADDAGRIGQLVSSAAAELPLVETRAVVERYRAPLTLLDSAARRASCRWDVPSKGQGFAAALPHLPELGYLVSVLALDARLHALEGRHDAALRDVRTGMAIVRHLAAEPTLVQAVAAASAMNRLLLAVDDLTTSRGSPNLYWSLAALPKPIVDPRSVARWERSMLELTVPGIDRALTGRLPPDEWDELVTRLRKVNVLTTGATLTPGDPTRGVRGSLTGAASSARDYVLAKRDLSRRPGFDATGLDGRPIEYVIGVWQYACYRDWTDDVWNAFQLPAGEAYAATERTQRAMQESVQVDGYNPFLNLVPRVERVRVGLESGERHLAALQAIEAARDYAATHGGRLPQALRGVDGLLPAPADPVTGRPFAWTAEPDGRAATLRFVVPEGMPGREESYRLIIADP